MLTRIEVENREEAELIRKGLAQPEVRALVKIAGALAGKTDRAKLRILAYAKDHFDEVNAG